MSKIISIIGGNGSMGKIYTKLFKKEGFKVVISDIGTKITNKEAAQKGDLILVSVPIDKVIGVINEIKNDINPNSCIFDITSIKNSPLNEMLKTKAKEVVGIHPMHGPSIPIKGQTYVLCKGRGVNGYNFLKNLFKKHGAIIEEIDSVKHDKMMAVIQGLTHFSDIVLAKTLEKLNINLENHLKLQSPSYKLKFEMMGRIMAQNANLYGSIQIENPENKYVIEKFIESCNELYEIDKNKDLQAFESYFNKSKKFLGQFAIKALKESNEIIKKFFKK